MSVLFSIHFLGGLFGCYVLMRVSLTMHFLFWKVSADTIDSQALYLSIQFRTSVHVVTLLFACHMVQLDSSSNSNDLTFET